MSNVEEPMVSARIGSAGLVTRITSLGYDLVADEPDEATGVQEGAEPFGLLYASLAACVLMTVRLYTTRKGWPLDGAEVTVSPSRQQGRPLESATVELTLEGDDLTDEQRARILTIARSCPVHRTLEQPVAITIALAG